MKKLLDVAHGKLINIIWHGILDPYLWVSVMPLNDHLCSKSAQKRQLLLGTVDQISRDLKRCYFSCNLIHALAKYNLESDAHSHKWGRLSVTSNQSLHLFNCSTKDKTRHSDCLHVLQFFNVGF